MQYWIMLSDWKIIVQIDEDEWIEFIQKQKTLKYCISSPMLNEILAFTRVASTSKPYMKVKKPKFSNRQTINIVNHKTILIKTTISSIPNSMTNSISGKPLLNKYYFI